MEIVALVKDDHVTGHIKVADAYFGKHVKVNGKWYVIQEHREYGQAVDLNYEIQSEIIDSMIEPKKQLMTSSGVQAMAVNESPEEICEEVAPLVAGAITEDFIEDVKQASVRGVINHVQNYVVEDAVDKFINDEELKLLICDLSVKLLTDNHLKDITNLISKEKIIQNISKELSAKLEVEVAVRASELLSTKGVSEIIGKTKDEVERKLNLLLSEAKTRVDYEAGQKIVLEIAHLKEEIIDRAAKIGSHELSRLAFTQVVEKSVHEIKGMVMSWGKWQLVWGTLWLVLIGALSGVGTHYLLK